MIEIESPYPTIDQLIAQQRVRRWTLFSLLILTVLIIAGMMGGLAYFFPGIPGYALAALGLAVFVCMAVPVVIWNQPRIGLYLLMVGVMLFGPGEARITMPTSYVPIWNNMSSIGQGYHTSALNALVFSPAELLMILTLLSWMVRQIALRDFHPRFGAFALGIAAYSVMVFYGWLHGITSGGDQTMALYEVRAQALFVMGYLLATNLITERKHILHILWIIVWGAGLLGIFGTLTYLSMGSVSEEGYMVHDNSLLLNMLFFVFILAMIFRLDWKLRAWSLALLPTAIVASLGNQRRAAIAALIVAMIPLLPMLYIMLKDRRAQVARWGVVLGLISAVYLPLAWKSEGIWALPARAIRSQSDPSARDASSDYYRLAETTNLKATRDLQPWTGIGYGKPFLQIVAMAAVTTGFLQYMTHNSVLWVWMRIGHIGFWCFYMMIGVVFIKGAQILREVQDPLLRAGGMFGILTLLMGYTFGKYDMLLVNGRQMFAIAVFIGILAVLKEIENPVAISAVEAE